MPLESLLTSVAPAARSLLTGVTPGFVSAAVETVSTASQYSFQRDINAALSNLLLPEPVRDLLKTPLQEMGFALTEKAVIDVRLTPLDHYCTSTAYGLIALLHLPAWILQDGNNVWMVSSVSDPFIGGYGGLFFFSNTDVDVAYETLADIWSQQKKRFKHVRFFGNKHLKALENPDPDARKIQLTLWLKLEAPPPPPPPPPVPSPPPPSRPVAAKNNLSQHIPTGNIRQTDTNRLTEILADQAWTAAAGPKAYFRGLILKTNLPEKWKKERANAWTGDSELDAIQLINWAVAKGVNPNEEQYKTLGSLLAAALNDFGLEERRWIVAFIAVYKLYLDPNQLDELLRTYNVPSLATQYPSQPQELGPAIDWKGPTDKIELQAWLKPEPEFIDVGYLKKVIDRAGSVCRVELKTKNRFGTGVLIAPTLLLTNFHVLKIRDDDDLEQNAKDLTLTFGYISGESDNTQPLTFKLIGQAPVLKSSPVEKLDYVLLRVEEKITGVHGIEHSTLSDGLPTDGMDLSILQHPAGETMKLAMSSNGVTGVYQNRGLVQYVTRTAGGASGAPCFDDTWKIVALHHAERTKGFGVIREGILSQAIYAEIKEFLS